MRSATPPLRIFLAPSSIPEQFQSCPVLWGAVRGWYQTLAAFSHLRRVWLGVFSIAPCHLFWETPAGHVDWLTSSLGLRKGICLQSALACQGSGFPGSLKSCREVPQGLTEDVAGAARAGAGHRDKAVMPSACPRAQQAWTVHPETLQAHSVLCQEAAMRQSCSGKDVLNSFTLLLMDLVNICRPLVLLYTGAAGNKVTWP